MGEMLESIPGTTIIGGSLTKSSSPVCWSNALCTIIGARPRFCAVILVLSTTTIAARICC